MMVDVEDGQKTGFFLDQKYNRLAMPAAVQGMPGYWTALPIPVPLPSMPVLPGLRSVLGVDASELGGGSGQQKMPSSNGLSDKVQFQSAPMCSTCCPQLERTG